VLRSGEKWATHDRLPPPGLSGSAPRGGGTFSGIGTRSGGKKSLGESTNKIKFIGVIKTTKGILG